MEKHGLKKERTIDKRYKECKKSYTLMLKG
jgi:hypothetical protein